MNRTIRTAGLALAALATATTLISCGDDDETETLRVDAVDFAYDDLPAEVDAGTRLQLHNSSSTEVHEAVVFRVAPEDAAAPLNELLGAAEADPMALGEFVGVSVALPGEDGVEPEGPVVFDEPGRYVVVCFVPTGADPDAYREALENGTQPEITDGAPHLVHGMVAELTVD